VVHYGGERIGQGRENTRGFLKENRDIFARIDAELRKKLSIGAAAKAEVPEVPAAGRQKPRKRCAAQRLTVRMPSTSQRLPAGSR